MLRALLALAIVATALAGRAGAAPTAGSWVPRGTFQLPPEPAPAPPPVIEVPEVVPEPVVVEPVPDIVIDEPPPPEHADITEAVAQPPPSVQTTSKSSLYALKAIVGLLAILVLAYLGGNRRVVKFQERLGLGGVIASGLPFIALGLIAGSPVIGILDHDTVQRLRPVLHFGLGWLGFIIGARFDIRLLDQVPSGTAYVILVESLGPFAIAVAGCGAVMVAFGIDPSSAITWRDLILLGAAAAMAAPLRRGIDTLIGQLDELVGVVGLLFITAFFRDATPGANWQLPATAWIFVSLGLGVALGALILAMVRVPRSNAEFLAVVIGSVAFASGLGGYLQLSPIVVCFLAGVLVTNFPNEHRESLFKILAHLERPLHLLFLVVAGALWDVSDWRGWVIVPLFVAARVLGRWLGMLASKPIVPETREARPLVVRVSSLSIALVISVEVLQHTDSLAWVVTAVIGGALLTEFLITNPSVEGGHDDDEASADRNAPITRLPTARPTTPTASVEPPRVDLDEDDPPA